MIIDNVFSGNDLWRVEGQNYAGCHIRSIGFYEGWFVNCDFSNTWIGRIGGHSGVFINCNFTNAYFKYGDICCASMKNCIYDGVTIGEHFYSRFYVWDIGEDHIRKNFPFPLDNRDELLDESKWEAFRKMVNADPDVYNGVGGYC